MPSLVLQFYNNQRNQTDTNTNVDLEQCNNTEDDNWYSPTQFELYNFLASLLEVLQVCYQMGYLVFVEKLTPIFEFKRVARKYRKLEKNDIRPYENYSWIIGGEKKDILIES